ncbi:MAG TPA: alpha/beta hydrolase [Gammaproteobacteria bacterium]|nr:alpha/beta hydrolase [Gammaproteobacteria bacterium]
MKTLRRLALPVLILLALAWGWQLANRPPPGRTLADGTRLEWGRCWFPVSWWRPVHCGWLQVRDGFRLPVVHLPARPWARRAAPVIYVSGGPGGATGLDAATFPAWLDWAQEVDWPSDIVLYDQRGVGLSRPAIDCPEVRAARRAQLASRAPLEDQYRALAASQRACLARLQGEGVDPGLFHTPANADDLLALVRAMGLERWRLYGVSYGTRVALEAMRRRPPGLEAVLLDSVYPPQAHGEAADAWLLDRALKLAERSCELLDCDTPRAQLRRWLETALQRLRREPLELVLQDPARRSDLKVLLDDGDLAWMIFDAEYQWDRLPKLPGLLRELGRDRPAGITRELAQESLDAQLAEDLSDPVANSVECSDNGLFGEAEFARLLRQFPRVAPFKRLDWRYGPCRFWPRAPVPETFRQPVHSAVPTLLLAGEFDPVTPPEWAEQAAATLDHAWVLIFEQVGHGAVDSDQCALEASRAFWRDPRAPPVPACLRP